MVKSKKLRVATIMMVVNGKRSVNFQVYHTINKIIFDEYYNKWFDSTNVYTAESLVSYIRDQGVKGIILTEKQYKEYMK